MRSHSFFSYCCYQRLLAHLLRYLDTRHPLMLLLITELGIHNQYVSEF